MDGRRDVEGDVDVMEVFSFSNSESSLGSYLLFYYFFRGVEVVLFFEG